MKWHWPLADKQDSLEHGPAPDPRRRADARVAGLLAVSPGTPCLVMERRTRSGSYNVTHVCLTYPGDKHELVADFASATS